jgi:hypothetical protein
MQMTATSCPTLVCGPTVLTALRADDAVRYVRAATDPIRSPFSVWPLDVRVASEHIAEAETLWAAGTSPFRWAVWTDVAREMFGYVSVESQVGDYLEAKIWIA